MSFQKDTPVFPHFKIVLLNETSYWPSEIQEKAGGAIFRAYLFDANRHVHCCELTPSYELYPLYTTPLVDNEDGELHAELQSNESYDVHYVHVRVLDAFPASHFHVFEPETVAPESWDELKDEYEGDANANVKIQIPAGYALPVLDAIF